MKKENLESIKKVLIKDSSETIFDKEKNESSMQIIKRIKSFFGNFFE